MNKKRLNRIFKQLLIVMIVFSLVFPVNLSAKKKRGAKLSVTMLTGGTINGELLRVNIRERTLLLMTSAAKTGVTINVNDIYEIRKKKKKKWWAGPIVVLSIGLAGGIAAGESDGFAFGVMAFGAIIGIPVGTIVLISSLIASRYKDIMAAGKSESKKTRLLLKLKSKARFKD